MNLTIWVVFGIFEGGGHMIALFLDENFATIRQGEWDKHEDCLETQVVGFETTKATDKELTVIK